MASKLPTLLLPAYDLRLKPKYRDFAEALYQLNKYRREAMTREAVDKLYVTAVRETYPHNKGKQDELIEQVSLTLFPHPGRVGWVALELTIPIRRLTHGNMPGSGKDSKRMGESL